VVRYSRRVGPRSSGSSSSGSTPGIASGSSNVLVNSTGGCSGSAVTSPRKLKRAKRLFRLNVPTATCTLFSDRLKQVRLAPAERPKPSAPRLGYVAALQTSQQAQSAASPPPRRRAGRARTDRPNGLRAPCASRAGSRRLRRSPPGTQSSIEILPASTSMGLYEDGKAARVRSVDRGPSERGACRRPPTGRACGDCPRG
jgi:hypothetical protein